MREPWLCIGRAVIERISGDAYHDHMTTKLLWPLDMNSATFGQPPADDSIATGHVLVD
ncbi:MAG: hypothetical protein CBC10_014140 [Gammaproteobacteria bacterium TMED50]|nr:MAG: hypothetical protein CBC10_014140 [Gammaproteobacteria bacterium TMED50]